MHEPTKEERLVRAAEALKFGGVPFSPSVSREAVAVALEASDYPAQVERLQVELAEARAEADARMDQERINWTRAEAAEARLERYREALDLLRDGVGLSDAQEEVLAEALAPDASKEER